MTATVVDRVPFNRAPERRQSIRRRDVKVESGWVPIVPLCNSGLRCGDRLIALRANVKGVKFLRRPAIKETQ